MSLKDLLQIDPTADIKGFQAEIGPYKVYLWVDVSGKYVWSIDLCLPDQDDCLKFFLRIASWNSQGSPLTRQKAINEAERVLLKVDRWLASKVGIEKKLEPRSDGLTALERVLKEDGQDFGR